MSKNGFYLKETICFYVVLLMNVNLFIEIRIIRLFFSSYFYKIVVTTHNLDLSKPQVVYLVN